MVDSFEMQRLKLPGDWINPISQIAEKKNFALQNLDPKSQGFSAIQDLVKQTIPAGDVRKVEIVQNLQLWECYQLEVKKIKNKLGKDPER